MSKVKDGDKFRIRIGDRNSRTTCIVEVVISPEAITRGLSGREELDSGNGMLFIFPTISKQNMWMPDMKFPLDIVWLDEEFTVINITKNCRPCPSRDECPNYPSKYMVKYAIEFKHGDADAYGFDVGKRLYVL